MSRSLYLLIAHDEHDSNEHVDSESDSDDDDVESESRISS